ncbi:transposase family protein [Streptomyces sp. NPDC057580]|uniref:transposase family protein n=1 Tax=Streptomyces sp. NPDC057580 TaxID=3346173 RepID=UPI0036A6BC4C
MHLRHQLPHVVLAELFEVDRSTVSAAIRQVRPLGREPLWGLPAYARALSCWLAG